MKSIVSWFDSAVDKDKNPVPVYCVDFSPDGKRLIAGAGTRVLVYNVEDGDLVQSLRGHKDTVFCVSYAHNGKRFASGGADATVIIWTDKLEGILKYSHNDALQCIAYNPVSQVLASCAVSDLVLWSPHSKSVQKQKLASRALCCSWTNDGNFLAIGLYSGVVSIRSKSKGEEKVRIQAGAPVWALQWNPTTKDGTHTLSVTDWNKKLNVYKLNGICVSKGKDLGFDPVCISYDSSGSYFTSGGSNKSCGLYSPHGVHLGVVSTTDSWIWSCKMSTVKGQDLVAVGTADGTISMYQLVFTTVHGLYQEQYAYRRNLTEAVVEHLLTQMTTTIQCHELIRKIAIYKDKLAIQLPSRIVVYSLSRNEMNEIVPTQCEKIDKKLDCNLLVVTSRNIVLCHERRLKMLSFSGEELREWALDSLIRYIKVAGGPVGREGLLVGMKDGSVVKIYLDNPFPVPLVNHGSSIRCLDMSPRRNKLAVVDEKNICVVYDMNTKQILFQDPNANSVAWNTQCEDMLSFSGNGMLSIKAGNFPTHQQKMPGFVVGFVGSKVFCLHAFSMSAIDVPQSAAMYQYLERGLFESAHRIACLGVTNSDWHMLAISSLEAMNLVIARKCFIRIRDLRFLDLVHSIEQRRMQHPDAPDDFFRAEIYSYQGKYEESAALYKKVGKLDLALNLFSDLRQFDNARSLLDTKDEDSNKKLVKKQAEWAKKTDDVSQAVDIYLEAGDHLEAIEIIGENGWMEKLLRVMRKLNKAETKALNRCAHFFQKNNRISLAAECYLKNNDKSALLQLRIDAHQWEQAFELANEDPVSIKKVWLPYAQWLAENDRYEEAQGAFREAGQRDQAVEVLEELTHNAVVGHSFYDAGYFYWMLASECLQKLDEIHDVDAGDGTSHEMRSKLKAKYVAASEKAELYFVYSGIYKFTIEPFSEHRPQSIFNMCRYFLNRMPSVIPRGISKVTVLYALSRQARALQAYKLARFANEKLQLQKIPTKWQELVDINTMTIRSKPFKDEESLVPSCYRCTATNPLLNNNSNRCIQCGQEFIHCFYSFEMLPLLEFEIERGLSDEEACHLIMSDYRANHTESDASKDEADTQEDEADSNRLVLGNDGDDDGDGSVQRLETAENLFTKSLMSYEAGDGKHVPVVVTAQMLADLPGSSIYVRRWKKPLRYQYFRLILPDVAVTLCQSCNHFFLGEDFEFFVLKEAHCPYCRGHVTPDGELIQTQKTTNVNVHRKKPYF